MRLCRAVVSATAGVASRSDDRGQGYPLEFYYCYGSLPDVLGTRGQELGYAVLYTTYKHSLLSEHQFSYSAGWLFLHTHSHRKFEQLIDPAAPKVEHTSARDREHAQEASRISRPTLDATAESEAANSISVLRGPKCAPASCLLRLIGRLTTQATDWF